MEELRKWSCLEGGQLTIAEDEHWGLVARWAGEVGGDKDEVPVAKQCSELPASCCQAVLW